MGSWIIRRRRRFGGDFAAALVPPIPDIVPLDIGFTNPIAIVQAGQSLSTGASGGAALTTVNPYPTDIFTYPNTTVAFVESGVETGVLAGAVQFREGLGRSAIMSVATVGVSARPIADFLPASNDLYQLRFQTYFDTLNAYDNTTQVICVPWIQGENDASAQASYSYYSDALDTLQSAITADAQLRLDGQDGREVALGIVQMSSGQFYQTTSLIGFSDVALAQFEKWKNAPDRSKWLFIGPNYCHAAVDSFDTTADQVHLRNVSYRHMGEIIGQAIYTAYVLGQPWHPLHVESVTINNDGDLVCTWSEPIEVDVTASDPAWTHQATSTYGLAIEDSSPQPARIVSVSKTGPSETTCTVEGTVHASSQLVVGAGIRGSRMNARSFPATGSAIAASRTNIRSTYTFVGETSGQTLAKWAVLHKASITGGAPAEASDGVATNDKTWSAGYFAKDAGATWAPMPQTPGAPTLTRELSGYTEDVSTGPFTAGGIGAANVNKALGLTAAKWSTTDTSLFDLTANTSVLYRWVGRIDRNDGSGGSGYWFNNGAFLNSGSRTYCQMNSTNGNLFLFRRNDALGIQGTAANAILPLTETWGIIDMIVSRHRLTSANTVTATQMWAQFYVNGAQYQLALAGGNIDFPSDGSYFSLFNRSDANVPLVMPAFCFFGVARGEDMRWWSPEQHAADVAALTV